MTPTIAWYVVLFLLIVVGESAHVRLAGRRGISPIASAAAVAFMLSLPHRAGATGVMLVLGGVLAVAVASLVGTAIAEAAGIRTTSVDVLGRLTNALVAGLLAQLVAVTGLERTMNPDGRDWIYAFALWLSALTAAAARADWGSTRPPDRWSSADRPPWAGGRSGRVARRPGRRSAPAGPDKTVATPSSPRSGPR